MGFCSARASHESYKIVLVVVVVVGGGGFWW